MELQEERKSHKECDQCIREQQMKINNYSNFATSSEFNMNSGQVLMQSDGYDIYMYTDIS
jgi:centromeric protein E